MNQELLLQVEYLAAENGILRAQALAPLRLSNAQRATPADIGKRLERKNLAKLAKPERIIGWAVLHPQKQRCASSSSDHAAGASVPESASVDTSRSTPV